MEAQEKTVRKEALIYKDDRYFRIRMKLRYPHFAESEKLSRFYGDIAEMAEKSLFSSDEYDESRSRRLEKSAERLDIIGDYTCDGTVITVTVAVYRGRTVISEKKVIHRWVEIDGEYYLTNR